MQKRGKIKHKSQAALEFLMTYGWVVMVVLVAIGALAYFGVLSPDLFVSSKCFLESGLGCADFKVDENSVTIVLRNGKGGDITVSNIQVKNCTGADIGFLGNGAEDTYIIDGCSHTPNEKFNGDINITYTTESGLRHKNVGNIVDNVEGGTSQSPTLLVDDFYRPDGSIIGNYWSETDDDPSAEAQILDNRLYFSSVDDSNQPLVSRILTKRTSGTITWTFTFNFERTGPEQYYEVFMQLGDSALMVDPSVSHNTGVAVNLKWGGDDPVRGGFDEEEGFGYTSGSTVTQVAVVSGSAGYNTGGDASITVTVDLDTNTFDLTITGAGLISGSGTATGVPFDNNVDIDTIRIYLDELNIQYFEDLEIGDILIVST
tara:strand:+ start:25918 stop:27036 length:1119 start_codon:yes stop_codon:yes gene_type:complete